MRTEDLPTARVVRAATPDDKDDVIDLLTRVGQWPGSREILGRLFTYEWSGVQPPNRGFVVDAGGKVVGFLGAVYSSRGEHSAQPLCSFSFYWVNPEHRASSLALLRAALRQPGYTFVSLSPNMYSQAILPRVGFVEFSGGYRLCPPLPSARSLFRRVRHTTNHEVAASSLTESERRAWAAHQRYGCQLHLFERGEGSTCLITKPRRLDRYPVRVSEVLYVRAPDVALRLWASVSVGLAWRDRTAAVVFDDSLAPGYKPPPGMRRRRRRLYQAPPGAPVPDDALYSELVLLLG